MSLKKERIDSPKVTLIGEIYGIEDFTESFESVFSGEGTPGTGFYGKIRGKFEEYGEKNPVVRNIIEGNDTFFRLVRKYTKPHSKALYPHWQKSEGDELEYLEECVGDFHKDNTSNLILNPPGFALPASLLSMALCIRGSEMNRRYEMIIEEMKKVQSDEENYKKILDEAEKDFYSVRSMNRRNFIKRLSFGTFAGTLFGTVGSVIKLFDYKLAELNAELLDILKKEVY